MSSISPQDCRVNIPDGESGGWVIEKFSVTEFEASLFNLRASIKSLGRHIMAGGYTQLKHHGEVVMSDTPAEISDHIDFINEASGDVFVTGLGIGMVASALAKKNNVRSITVVEASEDVINLVAPHLESEKITVIHADAFKYEPDKHFDFAWHDIWTPICSDNIPEMGLLAYHYRNHVDVQKFWCYEECVEQILDLDEEERMYPFIDAIEGNDYSLVPMAFLYGDAADNDDLKEKIGAELQDSVMKQEEIREIQRRERERQTSIQPPKM